MDLPVLYSFRRCPYAMRTRMAIARSGITVELREVSLRDVPKQMRKVSPKATVPVLLLPDGDVIDESIDVMYWALAKSDPDRWIDTETQAICDELVRVNDDEFKVHLDHYKYADRFPEHPAEKYRDEAQSFLSLLESRLAENEFLCADRVTLADIAIMPFIRQFSMVDQTYFDALPFTRLQNWLQYFLSLDLFAAIMRKFPVWQPSDDSLQFPAV